MKVKSSTQVRFRRSANGDLFILNRKIHSGDIRTFWRKVSLLLKQQRPHLVITLNVDQTIRLGTDLDYRRAFNEAAIVTLDGMPLVNFVKTFMRTKSSRLTGADLLLDASNFASANNYKMCLLGGAPVIAKNACENLRKMHPNLIVKTIDFPFLDVTDLNSNRLALVIGLLKDFKPHLVFICLGSPKQEIFFLNHKEILPPGIYIGSGASADFLGGWKKRAPQIIQHLSLEWAWRLIQEPRRLARRYLITGWRIMPIFLNSLKK